ncbi:MAG: thiamine phosphate synthase [Eggerthellaceae bacterium]
MALYAVTDRAWLGERTLPRASKRRLRAVRRSAAAREATLPGRGGAARLGACPLPEAGVPFVVNDDVEAARIAGADGVHVGRMTFACRGARLLRPDAPGRGGIRWRWSPVADGADYWAGAVFARPRSPMPTWDGRPCRHLRRRRYSRGGHRRPDRRDPRARGTGATARWCRPSSRLRYRGRDASFAGGKALGA